MQLKFGILISALIVIIGCNTSSPTADDVADTIEKNQVQVKYISEVQAIHKNFLGLSKNVQERSASLTDIEKQRAATFLTSAFDLVMESYLYKGDPSDPQMTDWMTPYRKFGGDNPHTIYTQIPVDQHYSYVLKGKAGNAFYLGVQLYGYQAGFNLPTANTDLNKLKLEKDGSFVLYVSEQRPANVQNWVPIQKGDHAIMIRQYFKNNSENIPASLSIQRTDSSTVQVSNYLARLQRTDQMITDYINGTLDVCDILRENALNNYPGADAEVKKPKYGGALYPTNDNTYEGFWISLQQGEAIHLHGKLPEKTPYASYVFYDRWYVTPDYRRIRSYLTNSDIVLNQDGSFDIFISPEKVDHPNWISTGGLYEGSFAIRYLLSASRDFPEVKKVRIPELKFQGR